MNAPTRPLRRRIKPLCRVCLRSSCSTLMQWPRVCRAAAPAAGPQPFTTGLADMRRGAMVSDDQALQLVARSAALRPPTTHRQQEA